MDIGLNNSDDFDALRKIVDISQSVERLRELLPANVLDLSPAGSDVAAFLGALPDPPVDPRLSIMTGLNSAAGCFLQIVRLITDNIPTEPVVLATLGRTALLGASRVVLVLGPDETGDRQVNAGIMLRQESESLMRLYNAAEKFVSFAALVPPQEVLNSQRIRAKAVAEGVPKLGEAAVLERTAAVVAQMLSTLPEYDEGVATQLREHLSWTFNVYSGVAHGFAWPRLVPGTSSLPGHFLAELTIIANVTHLAFALAIRRSTAPAQ